MKSKIVNPIYDVYARLQRAAEHFNVRLFNGTLSQPMFTLKSEKGMAGYFSADRWAHIAGSKAGEIAINPAYFASNSLLHLFQTIAHEQCHLWQHEFGKPSRPGYHNKEWATKMMEIGLMPSSTGEPDGKITGQKMSDYPMRDGAFIAACIDLIEEEFSLPWVDQGFGEHQTVRTQAMKDLRLPKIIEAKLCVPLAGKFKDLQQQRDFDLDKQKRKIKYHCGSCNANAWGKSGLSLFCQDCGVPFTVVSPLNDMQGQRERRRNQ